MERQEEERKDKEIKIGKGGDKTSEDKDQGNAVSGRK